MTSVHSDYKKGVEIAASAVITNTSGQVLLAESLKWKNLWLPPGGHVEPGESVFEAACREGEEEIGLKLKAKELINVGELIDDPDFDRKAHLLFFHVWCEVVGGTLAIDTRELREARWFDIDEALKVVNPGDTIENTLLRFKRKQFVGLDSRIYR